MAASPRLGLVSPVIATLHSHTVTGRQAVSVVKKKQKKPGGAARIWATRPCKVRLL